MGAPAPPQAPHGRTDALQAAVDSAQLPVSFPSAPVSVASPASVQPQAPQPHTQLLEDSQQQIIYYSDPTSDSGGPIIQGDVCLQQAQVYPPASGHRQVSVAVTGGLDSPTYTQLENAAAMGPYGGKTPPPPPTHLPMVPPAAHPTSLASTVSSIYNPVLVGHGAPEAAGHPGRESHIYGVKKGQNDR